MSVVSPKPRKGDTLEVLVNSRGGRGYLHATWLGGGKAWPALRHLPLLPFREQNRQQLGAQGAPKFGKGGHVLDGQRRNTFTGPSKRRLSRSAPTAGANHIRLSDIEPGFVGTACGKRGAELRPKFPQARLGTG
jgi:hypothetical protein